MKKHTNIILILLFFSVFGYGQLSYSLNLYSGISQVIDHFPIDKRKKEEQTNHKYCINESFKIGINVNYKIGESRYIIGSGLGLAYVNSKFRFGKDEAINIPKFHENELIFEDLEGREKVNYRILLNIPLKIYHIYEDWMWIYVGISSKIGVINELFDYNVPNYINYKNHTFEYNLGIDFLIKTKYIIGINYNRDISHQLHFSSLMMLEMYYKWHQAYIKLGYIIK